MNKKTVYLSGGIFGLTPEEANGWREKVKMMLVSKYKIIHPYILNKDEKYIVTKDKRDIAKSDILFVNAVKPSWGTAMEILFAYGCGKTIIVITKDYAKSPWLIYHSDKMFKTIKEAVEWLMNQKTRQF